MGAEVSVHTVGLTGGIGSGKSTVAKLLVEHGAVLVDADLVARQVVEPNGGAYQAVVDRFGPSVVGPGGAIDRPALAEMVFGDPEALADLNAITHPAIGIEMLEQKQRHAGSGRLVVLDIPLLRAEHRSLLGLEAVIVVDTPTEVALERLVHRRGMDRSDAEARIASQVDRDSRLSQADLVVDNTGSEDDLRLAVARLWETLTSRLSSPHPGVE